MPIELEITELNEYQKAHEYINGLDNHVTLNMLKKHGIKNKVAIRALKSNQTIMLCHPLEFGSNKFRNEKLYKKGTNEELITLCGNELGQLKKNKIINDATLYSFIRSGFNSRMMHKYHISVPPHSLTQLL